MNAMFLCKCDVIYYNILGENICCVIELFT